MISTPTRRGPAATASAHFPPERHSPRDARGFVAAHLDEWHCAAANDVALLLVSELVTNAVFHAQTEAEVEVGCFDDTVRIAVSDGVPAGIDPDAGRRPSAAGAPSGRGLRIVDGLADRWGVSMNDGGKTVWFEVHVPVAPPSEPSRSALER